MSSINHPSHRPQSHPATSSSGQPQEVEGQRGASAAIANGRGSDHGGGLSQNILLARGAEFWDATERNYFDQLDERRRRDYEDIDNSYADKRKPFEQFIMEETQRWYQAGNEEKIAIARELELMRELEEVQKHKAGVMQLREKIQENLNTTRANVKKLHQERDAAKRRKKYELQEIANAHRAHLRQCREQFPYGLVAPRTPELEAEDRAERVNKAIAAPVYAASPARSSLSVPATVSPARLSPPPVVAAVDVEAVSGDLPTRSAAAAVAESVEGAHRPQAEVEVEEVETKSASNETGAKVGARTATSNGSPAPVQVAALLQESLRKSPAPAPSQHLVSRSGDEASPGAPLSPSSDKSTPEPVRTAEAQTEEAPTKEVRTKVLEERISSEEPTVTSKESVLPSKQEVSGTNSGTLRQASPEALSPALDTSGADEPEVPSSRDVEMEGADTVAGGTDEPAAIMPSVEEDPKPVVKPVAESSCTPSSLPDENGDVEMADVSAPEQPVETLEPSATQEVAQSSLPEATDVNSKPPSEEPLVDTAKESATDSKAPTPSAEGPVIVASTEAPNTPVQAANGVDESLEAIDSPLSDLDDTYFTPSPSPTAVRSGDVPDSVEIYHDDGRFIGRIRPDYHRDNPAVQQLFQHLLSLPIQRPVHIRATRKFTEEDIEKIYQSSDPKGSKWMSTYIQATGEIQAQPCQMCAKNTGPYQECIIVGDMENAKCGNCEWARQACHGSSVAATARPKSQSGTAPAGSHPSASGFTAINGRSSSHPVASGSYTTAESFPVKNMSRKSLPSQRGSQQVPKEGAAPNFPSPEPELPSITKDNLCLRHDGTVYTDPPLIRGVPLEKISPSHSYWEPGWPEDIASLVKAEMDRWNAKFYESEEKGWNDHRKYEAKRQVNRGKAILTFLESGVIHPYQLVAKGWMDPHKIIKYNTLYRLAQMLGDELPRFKTLDVPPLDWMRHRLNEILLDKGDNFSLSRTVAGFYHDPKVEQVRKQNGFTSVGRPHKSVNHKTASSKGQPKTIKQKDAQSTPSKASSFSTPNTLAKEGGQSKELVQDRPRSSPRKPASAAGFSSRQDDVQDTIHSAGTTAKKRFVDEINVHSQPSTPERLKKRIRVTPTVITADSPDIDHDGYTSTDSCSADMLTDIDWRIEQIKTLEMATNTKVTQYWHWVSGTAGQLEHQVLKQVTPPKWAVFKHPYDFHLTIKELEEIVFAPGSAKVIIRHKAATEKGEMMAWFRRDRTKKRFLRFMLEKRIKVIRSNKEYIEGAWTDMVPGHVMPANEVESGDEEPAED